MVLSLPLASSFGTENPAAGVGRQTSAERVAPELIVDVDVNDEVWLRDHNMTEADVRTLVAQLKQNGCETLLVRCGCLGLLPYRTDLSYPLTFDAEDARAFLGDLDAYIRQRTAWNKRYAEVIRDINPPAVLKARTPFWADVTRKHGFDGIDMHEAWNCESHPDNMGILGSMNERLKSKSP